MDKTVFYNPEKLSTDRNIFSEKKVLLQGCGAVGSYIAPMLIKLGIKLLVVVDFEHYVPDNYSKSCEIIRKKDIGRYKAEALADEVQYLLSKDQTCTGINGSVFDLGPEAYSIFDAVFVALDNDNAVMNVDRTIKSLAADSRPTVLLMGTNKESAVSTIMDYRGLFMSDLVSPDWVTSGHIVYSCTGRQLRDDEMLPKHIIPTSSQASNMAALLSVTQFRNSIFGLNVMNKKLNYYAYPRTIIEETIPRTKGATEYAPMYNIDHRFAGSVLDKSLDAAFEDITKILGSNDFEIPVHNLIYGNRIVDTFLAADECHCCGKPIKVMKYSSRISLKDLRCAECAKAGKTPRHSPEFIPTVVHTFTRETAPEIRAMTLFELGFPLGAHIFVRCGDKEYVFTYKDDAEVMQRINKL